MKKLIILLAVLTLISCKKEEEKRPIHSYWEELSKNTTYTVEYNAEIVVNTNGLDYGVSAYFIYNTDTIIIRRNCVYEFFINSETNELKLFEDNIGTTDNYKVICEGEIEYYRFETY